MKEKLIIDANYCLLCKKPSCVEGCPARVNIPGMMKHVQEGNFDEAYQENRKQNVLPFLCGELCPHEKQCEGHCIRAKKGKSVNIGFVEHGVAKLFNNQTKLVDNVLKDKKIAIVGAGMTGISAALELASHQAKVTIFEKEAQIGGAVAKYLPSFRFNEHICQFLYQDLVDLKVDILFNQELGVNFFFDDLLSYDYQIIALGAEIPLSGGLPINLPNVYFGLDLLKIAKKDKRIPFINKKVLVIGAGNVAMDVARLIRLAQNDVEIVYRRTIIDSPASKKEIEETLQEGVLFQELLSPLDIIETNDHLTLNCQVMKLDEENNNDRHDVLPKMGEYRQLTADVIVLALGNVAKHDWVKRNPTKLSALLDEQIIHTDYQDYYANLYLGGDYLTGPKTIVKAMVQGRDMARDILRRHQQEKQIEERIMFGGSFNPITKGHLDIITALQKEKNATILIVPNGDLYPQKDLAPFAHRLRMIQLAIKDLDNITVLDIENQESFKGTVSTLRKLGHPLFVLGADSVKELPTWIEYENLLKENHFLVFNRDKLDYDRLFNEDERLKPYKNHFQLLKNKISPTSSTTFRTTLDKSLVPDSVYQYIIKHKLYQNK